MVKSLNLEHFDLEDCYSPLDLDTKYEFLEALFSFLLYP